MTQIDDKVNKIKISDYITKIDDTVNKTEMTPRGEFHLKRAVGDFHDGERVLGEEN